MYSHIIQRMIRGYFMLISELHISNFRSFGNESQMIKIVFQ